MEIIVCGSVSYGGLEIIQDLHNLLKTKGFITYNHISEEGMDYSYIKDFKNHQDIALKIVTHDIKSIQKTDVVVTVLNGPSYGAAIEMNTAKQSGIPVISLCENGIPTPFIIYLSDYIVSSRDDLINLLNQIKESRMN